MIALEPSRFRWAPYDFVQESLEATRSGRKRSANRPAHRAAPAFVVAETDLGARAR